MEAQGLQAIVDQVARGFVRKGYSAHVDLDDICQEGMRIALAAALKTDPKMNPEGYVYTAVSRELGNYISKQVAVPSIHGNWTEARFHQVRCGVGDEEGGHDLPDEQPTPEARTLDFEREHRMSRWKIELRRKLLSKFKVEEELSIVERLYGLDGFPSAETPARVAEQLGCNVRKVYRVTQKIAKLAGDLEVYQLRQAYAEIGGMSDE